MVRKYQRTTTSCCQCCYRGANGLLQSVSSAQRAADDFRATCAKKDANPDYTVEKRLGPVSSVFTAEQEVELSSYLTSMEGQLFDLTIKELCQLAFQLDERNNIKQPFNTQYGSAGRDCVKGFLA